MPVIRVQRTGVRPAPREVPTDTTAAVLPMTLDRVGVEAPEDEAPAKVSDLRPVLGTTRRILIPLLEHLDKLRITIRDGGVGDAAPSIRAR